MASRGRMILSKSWWSKTHWKDRHRPVLCLALTHTFQVITKVRGDDHRTVATIALRQYTDEDTSIAADGSKKFESGKVNIWREKATDTETHGTTIVLLSIRLQARDTLRSREIWSAIEHNELQTEGEERQAIDPPFTSAGSMKAGNCSRLLTKGRRRHRRFLG